MRSFTRHELIEYDGAGDKPSYVGYKGKVYDVSAGPNWPGGSHFQHNAGEDLTDVMQDAPHGEEVMETYPVVGELA